MRRQRRGDGPPGCRYDGAVPVSREELRLRSASDGSRRRRRNHRERRRRRAPRGPAGSIPCRPVRAVLDPARRLRQRTRRVRGEGGPLLPLSRPVARVRRLPSAGEMLGRAAAIIWRRRSQEGYLLRRRWGEMRGRWQRRRERGGCAILITQGPDAQSGNSYSPDALKRNYS